MYAFLIDGISKEYEGVAILGNDIFNYKYDKIIYLLFVDP
jgi:hypothetical protein